MPQPLNCPNSERAKAVNLGRRNSQIEKETDCQEKLLNRGSQSTTKAKSGPNILWSEFPLDVPFR